MNEKSSRFIYVKPNKFHSSTVGPAGRQLGTTGPGSPTLMQPFITRQASIAQGPRHHREKHTTLVRLWEAAVSGRVLDPLNGEAREDESVVAFARFIETQNAPVVGDSQVRVGGCPRLQHP